MKAYSQQRDYYERKLERVMERFGVLEEDYRFSLGRWEAWIEFKLRGDLYRFDQTVNRAKDKGVVLGSGKDCFAQLVVSLEDLARMDERGIYELKTWLAGMKMLPEPQSIPHYFHVLGFERIPDSPSEVEDRWRQMAKAIHPDQGGSSEHFSMVHQAYKQALGHFELVES